LRFTAQVYKKFSKAVVKLDGSAGTLSIAEVSAAVATRAGPAPLVLRKPYLVFLGDVEDPLTAKTAFGLRDWIKQDLIGQWRSSSRSADLGLPDMTPEQAASRGAGSIIVGAAPAGGQLSDNWEQMLARAARAGLDLVAGLHSRLADRQSLADAAREGHAAIFDIRHFDGRLPIGTGMQRSGKRLLTVGTDCAIGKKYAALAIAREMQSRGMNCDFRATGQTGIMIAGRGISIDAVVADFVSGAAELISPANQPSHWDVIEGQGSLFHPSYAGVALGLLHGSQPDALVLCCDPFRSEIDGCPGFPIPSIEAAIERNLEAARLTNPDVRCVGISINTHGMNEASAAQLLAQTSDSYGLPCIDPYRWGAAAIVDALN
jgi:uncharacterized NAD-dependent epimerase/dehydratase family protein